MANSVGNDKTANKVALCSAVFAGFAYVGYSVVRTAFCRKLGQREGEGGKLSFHPSFSVISVIVLPFILDPQFARIFAFLCK